MGRAELLTEINSRLQIALTLSIFLPTLLTTFLAAHGVPPNQAADNGLVIGGLIAFFLTSYIIFQLGKECIPEFFLRWLNRALLFGITLFIAPTIHIAAIATGKASAQWIQWVNAVSAVISLRGLPIAAIATFLLVAVGIGVGCTTRRSHKQP